MFIWSFIVRDVDYVLLGCGGDFGTFIGRKGGKQDLSIPTYLFNTDPELGGESDEYIIGTLIHQLMHVAGVYHEHNRQDRDDFVTIESFNCIDNPLSIPSLTVASSVTSYDFRSIMHTPLAPEGGCFVLSVNGQSPIPEPEIGNPENGLSLGDIIGINHLYPTPSTICSGTPNSWLTSKSAQNPWQVIRGSTIGVDELRFGDFNGNGKTDVFRHNGTEWQVSWDGTSDWFAINASENGVDELRFEDINGDGRTDVLRHTGTSLQVSYSGIGDWFTIFSTTISPENFRFGDFNGDGRTDILRHNGTQWLVSYSNVTNTINSNWTFLRNSNIGMEKLRIGDFNGDGTADVFRHNGSQWQISYSGNTDWTTVATSNIGVENLGFGDFNGDGSTDVFRHGDDDKWYAAYSAIGGWNYLTDSNFGLDVIRFGDFDGDKKTDVFRTNND